MSVARDSGQYGGQRPRVSNFEFKTDPFRCRFYRAPRFGEKRLIQEVGAFFLT